MDGGTIHDEPRDESTQELDSYPTLIVLSGARTGQVFRLAPGSHIIGRAWDADIFLDDDSVSRKHAELERTRDGHYTIRDLGSTNGTKLNGCRITSRPCRVAIGDRIRLSSTVVVKLRVHDESEEEMHQALYNMAIYDPLTGAFNKRYFAERIDQEVAFARRHRQPLSLLILDIDHFKTINDTYGHHIGDEVLQQLAQHISTTLRAEDIFSRFGGEEFVVLMRDTTADEALVVAERLRVGVEALRILANGQCIQLTISLGLATTAIGHQCSSMDLFSRADKLLYMAKNSGRNRIGFVGAPRVAM